jgi:alpha-1,2-mannosyltransferase
MKHSLRSKLGGRSDGRGFVLVAFGVIFVLVLAAQHGRKVSQDRSAFVRWRAQIQQLVHGSPSVYDGEMEVGDEDNSDGTLSPYPNPPLMAVILYPLAILPKVPGALSWFFLKVAMAGFAIGWSLRLAAGRGQRVPVWVAAVVLVLSFRMILSDLQHGNVNILICFLVVAGLWSFAQGRDWAAGLLIGLATALKVTPALFIPYFLYKRQWRMVGWTLLGLAAFFLVVPGLVLGFRLNWVMLVAWFQAMIEPYVMRGVVETMQINQSIPGLLHRLLTDSLGIKFSDGVSTRVNVASMDPRVVGYLVRAVTLFILLWLAWVCRTRVTDRRDWRLACEYGLVLLAMLFISERSWKHHYVVMILPIACVVSSVAFPRRAGHSRGFRLFLLSMLGLAMLLMMSTSKEMTGWMARDGNGHKWAQAYNTFMWAGVAVFAAVCAILIRARRADTATDPAMVSSLTPSLLPGEH